MRALSRDLQRSNFSMSIIKCGVYDIFKVLSYIECCKITNILKSEMDFANVFRKEKKKKTEKISRKSFSIFINARYFFRSFASVFVKNRDYKM